MQIEYHQKFFHLFLIFNLKCCKFIALKENAVPKILIKVITLSQPSTLLRVFHMRRSGYPSKGGTQVATPTSSFFCCVSPPFHQKTAPNHLSSDHRPNPRKNISLIAFRQCYHKFACHAHFELHNHDSCQKARQN